MAKKATAKKPAAKKPARKGPPKGPSTGGPQAGQQPGRGAPASANRVLRATLGIIALITAIILVLLLLNPPTVVLKKTVLMEDPFTTPFILVSGNEVESSSSSSIEYTITPLSERPDVLDSVLGKISDDDMDKLQMYIQNRNIKLVLHRFSEDSIRSFLGMLSKDAIVFTNYASTEYREFEVGNYKISLLERVDVYSTRGYDYVNTIPLPVPGDFESQRLQHKKDLKDLRYKQAESAALDKVRDTRNRVAREDVNLAAIKAVMGR